MGVKHEEREQVTTGEVPRTAPPGAEETGERSEPASGAQGGAVRGRPGRRTVAERREAVLSGKASVDQTARRYGDLPETVTGWRDQALSGIETVLARGDSRSPRE